MRPRPTVLVSAAAALAVVLGAGSVATAESRGPSEATSTEFTGTAVTGTEFTGAEVAEAVTATGEAVGLARISYRVVKRTTCRRVHGHKRCTTKRVRVAVAPTKATTKTTAKKAPVKASAVRATSTAPFAYLASDTKARPAHWNRCATISYRVNPAGLPTGGLAEVKTALAKLSKASGLRFAYAGTTSVVPYASAGWGNNVPAGQPAGLYIAWSDAAHVSYLQGDVAGIGGPYYQSDSTREPQIVRAGVTLDRAAKVGRGFGAGPRTGTLLLHELGHTVNLNHVNDPTEVMNPAVTATSHGDYQAGDLAGLRRLAAYPCF